MESDDATRTEGRTTYVYPACACWPGDRTGAYLFGGFFVAMGGFWLLSNLGLIPWPIDDLIWPLALVGIGIAALWQASTLNRP